MWQEKSLGTGTVKDKLDGITFGLEKRTKHGNREALFLVAFTSQKQGCQLTTDS